MTSKLVIISFFFFNDTATTEIYTLSLHDALPICPSPAACEWRFADERAMYRRRGHANRSAAVASHRPVSKMRDRKSTRLNSSHGYISYARFCLKKKKKKSSQVYQFLFRLFSSDIS